MKNVKGVIMHNIPLKLSGGTKYLIVDPKTEIIKPKAKPIKSTTGDKYEKKEITAKQS